MARAKMSRSTGREVGATALGGVAGGLIGREIGRRTHMSGVAGIGGALVGALLANAAESSYEQNRKYGSGGEMQKFFGRAASRNGSRKGRSRGSRSGRRSRTLSRMRGRHQDDDEYR